MIEKSLKRSLKFYYEKNQDQIKIEKLEKELKEIKKNQTQSNSSKSANLPIIITSAVVSLTALLAFAYFMSNRYINLTKQDQQQTNTKPQKITLLHLRHNPHNHNRLPHNQLQPSLNLTSLMAPVFLRTWYQI